MVENLILLPDALSDAAEAYDWYNERRAGLGLEFLACVDQCIERIRQNPEQYEVVLKDYRRPLVRRFPYVVFYEHAHNQVTVYAIFHSAQNPAKWRKRLE